MDSDENDLLCWTENSYLNEALFKQLSSSLSLQINLSVARLRPKQLQNSGNHAVIIADEVVRGKTKLL